MTDMRFPRPQQGPPVDIVDNRAFSASNPYMLPVDLKDMERQNFQHHALRMMMHGYWYAPLTDPLHATVLDIGTGPGKWPMEVAGDLPLTRVFGVDIIAPRAQESVPRNYTFLFGNVLERLPFTDGMFDLTHQRMLNFAIPENQWLTKVLPEMKRVTRRGGWIELMEWGGYLHDPPRALQRLVEVVSSLSRDKQGINLFAGAHVQDILQLAYCANVDYRILWMPVGRHGDRDGQRIGHMMQVDALALIEGLRPPITALRLLSENEFDGLMQQAKTDLDNSHLGNAPKCYMPFYIAWGQVV